MVSDPISLWQIDGKTMETVTDFIFLAAVTDHSDSGAQENKICHCFHIFSFLRLCQFKKRACRGLSSQGVVLKFAEADYP